MGQSEKAFWLDCNKWSITFLVTEDLDKSEILFEISYSSINEFAIDRIGEDAWCLSILLDKHSFKLVLSAEHCLIKVLRRRLSRPVQKPSKESTTSSPIVINANGVKCKKREVGTLTRIHSLLVSESRAAWSSIRKLHGLLLHRLRQVHAQHRQGIDSSE